MAGVVDPRVSVVMAVYNGARFLAPAVDSILGQTYRGFEFIMVDDGSNDATPEMLEHYRSTDRRIRILKNLQNIGLTKSLNRGMKAAGGRYVARMDADDVALPTRLERQMAVLDGDPGLAVVGCWAKQIDAAGNVTRSLTYDADDAAIRTRLLLGNYFVHGAVMLRRRCFFAVGGYDERIRYAQDYDLWLRLSERFAVANVPEYLYLWRKIPEAGTSVIHQQPQLQSADAIRQTFLRTVVLQHPNALPAIRAALWIDPNDELLRGVFATICRRRASRRAWSAYLWHRYWHNLKQGVKRAMKAGLLRHITRLR